MVADVVITDALLSKQNDALNSIVNAERKGKRQVLVRPSSKVVIKFLSVMQKHGKFLSLDSPAQPSLATALPRTFQPSSQSSTPEQKGNCRLHRRASIRWIVTLQRWRIHGQDRRRSRTEQQNDAGSPGVITNGHLAGCLLSRASCPYQRSSLRLRNSKHGNCYAYRVEGLSSLARICANSRRATLSPFPPSIFFPKSGLERL